MAIKRGEVYYLRLGPVVGREMDHKRRPVVVLSIDDTNSKPLVITVVPGTTGAGKRSSFRNVAVVPPTASNGLSSETHFLGHQVRAIDHSRFTDPPAGTLSSQELTFVEGAVRYNLALF